MRSHIIELTGVCEGLDVVRQVDIYTLCVLHLLENDPNEPHGHKVVPVAETHQIQNNRFRIISVS